MDLGDVAPGSIRVFVGYGRRAGEANVSNLLLLTNALEPSAQVLPALGLLLHSVRVAPAEATALIDVPPADAVMVDARRELAHAKGLCRLLRTTGVTCPLMVIVTEGGLAAMTAEWGVDDVLLDTAGPAEVEARLRMAVGRLALQAVEDVPDEIRSGDLAIDEATYTARLRGRVLDLTFKEFELLKYLAQHPGRVFSRAQLLQEVWGYDYFGGTRTVDVHVRRLRAKLGAENEALIGTVRNVGYRFVPGEPQAEPRAEARTRTQAPAETAKTAGTGGTGGPRPEAKKPEADARARSAGP
ncbi:transcriptional regulatory protein GlnR [Sphaerimonospora thailandensis]|uniref:Transcriptional regulatory protein GlnR n=1 Tax=Sphaerimonospora thailandensis TaxID=795644 RepID=A0A8J3RC84_9ACTN|nr:transcriptional regulatory protein GlnR [Sphaerimonospora thailandensis]